MEFWDLPPSKFFAILKRYREEQRRQNARFGLLATIVSSIFAKNSEDVPQPLEWFEAKNEPEMNEAKLEKVLNAFFAPIPNKENK